MGRYFMSRCWLSSNNIANTSWGWSLSLAIKYAWVCSTELKASVLSKASAIKRWLISKLAWSWANLAWPKPFVWQKSCSDAPNKPRNPPNFVREFLAKSIALQPLIPVRRKIAKSSESDKVSAPWARSFSLGRSCLGQSVIFMLPCLNLGGDNN